MIFAHGNTPIHDDPAFLSWASMAAVIGIPATVSFAWYWMRHR